MPWPGSVMDHRLRFVSGCLAGDATMTELCEAAGISRKTGYKWLGRYEAEGVLGLADRSHAPRKPAKPTPQELCEKLVELRRARPHWGTRKLLAKLEQRHPGLGWPSHSTADEILRRAGLIHPRPLRRRPPPRAGELTAPERPNHVWAVDHKGWVTLGDGARCEPLTLVDSYSRFLLGVSCGSGVSVAENRPVFERVFREFGLPEVIRSDNGSPFAKASPTGLTRLSAWWIKLGIRPERIDPGCPQQNGRLERLHATLLEAMRPLAPNRSAQARRFDTFRRDYNEERPHQALGQSPPMSFYAPSPRPMPDRLPEPDYPSAHTLRRVRSNGQIKLYGRLVHVSSALCGETIALEEIELGWRVWFYQQPVAILRHAAQKVSPIIPG